MVLKGVVASGAWLLLGAQLVAGQERATLSLADALARAEGASEDVAIAAAGVLRGHGEELRARSQYFPQLSATVAYSRALASEFKGAFGSASQDTASAPADSSGGGLDFSNLPFGRENTWQLGLQLTQSVWAGGRIRAQNRIADASRTTAAITLASTRAEALLEVASAYYDAALSERLLAIAEATLAQAEETLRQTRLGEEVGQQPEFDLLRAQVQRDNQLPVVIQRRSQRELAQLRLKQLLEIPAATELTLSTPLDEAEQLPLVGSVDTTSLPPAAERAPVRQAAEAVRVQQATLDVAQAQRYPTINLTSNYTRVNYPTQLTPDFDEFRTNWTVGLSLQVPLFTGGRITGDEVVARSELTAARSRLRQTVELTELDTRSAQQQLEAAAASWRASAGTVEQAERAYAIAELRYREGISPQLELSDARILLQQAQATRAAAARDLQVARIRVALLEDLPLGSTVGGNASGGFTSGGAPAGAGGQAGGSTPAAGSLPTASQTGSQGGSTGAGGAQRGPGGSIQ